MSNPFLGLKAPPPKATASSDVRKVARLHCEIDEDLFVRLSVLKAQTRGATIRSLIEEAVSALLAEREGKA